MTDENNVAINDEVTINEIEGSNSNNNTSGTNNEAIKIPFYCTIWFISLVGAICAFFIGFFAFIPVLVLEIPRIIKMKPYKNIPIYSKKWLISQYTNAIPLLVVYAISYLIG